MKTINTYYSSNDDLNNFIKKNNIQDSSKLLIQVFTSKNDYTFIKNLTEFFSMNFPLASLIGSTTDGEIKDGEVSINSAVISFTIFEKVSLNTYISNKFDNYFEAGANLATNIIKEDSKVIISFIDGLLGNGEEYLKGIHSINKTIIVAGGLAGDNAMFTQTYVFTKDTIYLNGVVGISLSSFELKVFTDYSFNWHPIGQKLKITKADKNRVYTINNKTALETYNYYLGGDISKNLPHIGIEFPLILEKNGITIARAVIGKNDDGSLIFAGNLEEEDEVRFGYGQADAILGNTQHHIDKLYNQAIESIFIYSCMARRRFMPDKIESETLMYNQIAPTSGFYTYGEFFSTYENKELLNQSMTILAISESPTLNKKKIIADIGENESSTVQALSHLIHVSTKELQEKDEIMITQSRNAAMGEILNMVAHQWRQPLNLISMNANNIIADVELDCLDEESMLKNVKSILEESSSLSQIIDDFRNYFTPEKDKEKISIETIIQNTKKIIDLNLKDNDIQLVIKNRCESTIYTHKEELMQVLLNLINNSKEAFQKNEKEKKLIIILIEEKNENIEIKICDNAGGIDNAIINNIFNPYFSTKNELNGTGLGLYMSKIVIEKYMNGKICVNNMKDGACFSIYIPK
ncbi:MAG: FIST N-terminal domain-containing protein [Halarcobacter sp.]